MPLNQTLTDGLDGYAIGRKIRDLRIGRKLGLVELGRHTGLSAALLSKIERGKMYPTLPTLLRISLVFGVDLNHFFAQDHRVFAVVREAARQRFPEKPGTSQGSFHFQALDYSATARKTNAYLAEFRAMPVDDVKLHRHSGAEFIYVLEGKMGLYARNEETTLAKGDSVYFDSNQQHGYRRVGRKTCLALVVISPGTSDPA
jgi:quercetin dioxygenase-like cupin family protein/DNA-binding XRE family transcriptional regulator